MRFVDTNVLLYALSSDPGERAKAERANETLRARDLALSVEVLQEFYVQATRRKVTGRLSHDQAVRMVESLLRFPVQELTTEIMLAAFASCQRFRISYWDAAIIEAARALGCRVVLSEDLVDGRDYDGVLVENPLR